MLCSHRDFEHLTGSQAGLKLARTKTLRAILAVPEKLAMTSWQEHLQLSSR